MLRAHRRDYERFNAATRATRKRLRGEKLEVRKVAPGLASGFGEYGGSGEGNGEIKAV